MIKWLIQRNSWSWELTILSLSLIVTLFISSGCYQRKPRNELQVPIKFEVERFYDYGCGGPTLFSYIKISKGKTISVEYFSTPNMMGYPDYWSAMTEQLGDSYCPKYKQTNLTLDEFRMFWEHFQEVNLIQLPDLITEPGKSKFYIPNEGMLRFQYKETEGNNEKISKQLYIRGDGGELWGGYLESHPVISATRLILEQTRFVTNQVQGVNAVEIIKPKLLEIYYSLNDSEGSKENGIRRSVIEALITLGEIQDPKAVIPLIKDLKSSRRRIRSAAAWALGSIKDSRAVIPLIETLGDSNDDNVSSHAMWALGEIKDCRAVEPLINVLTNTDKRVVDTAFGALIKITEHDFGNKKDNKNPELWKKWWKENKDYIYWSDKENKSLIDEEAKKTGIPTDEYRKTHPWHKEDKPNDSNQK